MQSETYLRGWAIENGNTDDVLGMRHGDHGSIQTHTGQAGAVSVVF